MKILVCFKVIPDLDLMMETDWATAQHCQVETQYVKKIINPYDEAAIELSLKLRDRLRICQIPVELWALTIGDRTSDRTLKHLYSLGFDKAVRIHTEQDVRFCAEFISDLIVSYDRRRAHADLMILGQQSGEGDQGKTPFLVAEKLGRPCINGVTDIQPTGTHPLLEIESRRDYQEIRQTVQCPLVLAVGNIQHSYLRIPTLKDKMTARHIDVILENPEEIHGTGEAAKEAAKGVKLVSLARSEAKRAGQVIGGSDAAQKARQLATWLEEEGIRC